MPETKPNSVPASSKGTTSLAGAPAPGTSPVVLDAQALASIGSSEWVMTNALGGFAMGTARGIPERRYHGWLVGATTPPVGRIMALHSCAEWLVVERLEGERVEMRRYDLTSYRFPDGTLHPRGVANLLRFEQGVQRCRWEYEVENEITITRELTLVHERNVALVRYRVLGLRGRGWLEIRPMLALRDFHALLRETPGFCYQWGPGRVQVQSPGGVMEITVARDRLAPAPFGDDGQWWRNFEYVRDRERGQDSGEDLYSPGVFVVKCDQKDDPKSEILLSAALAGASGQDSVTFDQVLQANTSRVSVEALPAGAKARRLGTEVPELPALLAAADQFVVRRLPATPGTGWLTSIIAGYPWFSDWGRDTFISMRGLLLSTGRYAEALQVLSAFAGMQRRGLIPNCFDNSGAAEYNTVDASLWFVHAACEYVRVSGDRAGFSGIVRDACLNVVDAYRQGTEFDIRMDKDGLITAGSVGTQLTWMDARRDGVVFTPRHGKAVEINALWYSGLLELAAAIEPDLPRRARELQQVASLAGQAFAPTFWNPELKCLYDVVTPTQGGWKPDARVRPNQAFAVSQPYSALSNEQQRAVVETVRSRLLTPMGLRTLDPSDPGYFARFEGSLRERDAAYHNGTVWPWLIGPYCEALMRSEAFSTVARQEARQALKPLLDELTIREGHAGPIRQLAEVYDADDAPTARRPEGCMAQAWSVAEVLRALVLTLEPQAKPPSERNR